MKKIVSFGDSFILGDELKADKLNSPELTWPGLIAAEMGTEFETCAITGCGNEAILKQILNYFSNNSTQNTLAVINWTWAMRWDFFIAQADKWVTLGPTCAPEKLYQQLEHNEAKHLIDFYKTYQEGSAQSFQYRSLQAIYTAQQFLKANQIPSVETYMDSAIFSKYNTGDRVEHYNAFKDDHWPVIDSIEEIEQLPGNIKAELEQDYNKIMVPDFINTLQDLTFPSMLSFDGQNFLDWSRSKGFEVTPAPKDHPLTEAHRAAADFWYTYYNNIL